MKGKRTTGINCKDDEIPLIESSENLVTYFTTDAINRFPVRDKGIVSKPVSSLSAMFSWLNSNCAIDGLVAFGNDNSELNHRNKFSQISYKL